MNAHAADPIEDLDTRRALQRIDVADLADATDGTDALRAVPGVKRRRLDGAKLLAGCRVPNHHVPYAVAGRQVSAVVGVSAHVEHRAEIRRRAFLVAAQLVQLFAGGDVSNTSDHVIGDSGDFRSVRRKREMAQLPRMGVDGADSAAILRVPPDEPAVVCAGHYGVADDAHAGDVAAMVGVFDGLDVLLSGVDLVDL